MCSNYSASEIQQDINQQNAGWLKVCEVIVFKSGKGLKIVCETTEMTQRCLRTGFFMLNLSINPSVLSEEEYTHVVYCFRCYGLDHVVADCKCPPEYKICSNCTSSDHTYRECTASDAAKCINCPGASHHTMAYSCPKRKDYIQRKKSSSRSFNIMSKPNYSAAVKINATTHDSIIKSQLLLSIAFEKTKENPSKFESLLNSLLRENDLPLVKLGSLSGNFSDVDFPERETKKIGESYIFNTLRRMGVPSAGAPPLPSASVPPPSHVAIPPPSLDEVLTQKTPPHSPVSPAHLSASSSVEPAHPSASSSAEPPKRPILGADVAKKDIHLDIQIYKRQDYTGNVNRRNLRKLANDGKIFVSCSVLTERERVSVIWFLLTTTVRITSPT